MLRGRRARRGGSAGRRARQTAGCPASTGAKVTHIKLGPVSAEVTIDVAPGVDIVPLISTTSAEDLELEVGSSAFAVIKASSVMVGVDHA